LAGGLDGIGGRAADAEGGIARSGGGIAKERCGAGGAWRDASAGFIQLAGGEHFAVFLHQDCVQRAAGFADDAAGSERGVEGAVAEITKQSPAAVLLCIILSAD